jgi:HK97 gp10 family phage protein
MAEVEFKISGLAELDKALRELPLKASRKIVREEVKKAVEPWAAIMRGIVPSGKHRKASGEIDYGLLRLNIITTVTVRSDLSASGAAGPAKKVGNYLLFWARFLEFGRAAGRSRRGRKYPGMSARPFVRPAFEMGKSEVLDRFVTGIRRSLEAVGLHLSK